MKMELFENTLQIGGISKHQIFIFKWTENTLKTDLFESNGIAIIMRFPCPSIFQTQIQNNW